jgi:hypothetical protein
MSHHALSLRGLVTYIPARNSSCTKLAVYELQFILYIGISPPTIVKPKKDKPRQSKRQKEKISAKGAKGRGKFEG